MRQRNESKIIEIDVEILHQTEKALLIDTGKADSDGKPVGVWVPKSRCQYDEAGGTLQIAEWIAIDKGLV